MRDQRTWPAALQTSPSGVLPAGAAPHREETALLGMTIFVAAWAMLFAALFFTYGALRARAVAWPPPEVPRLPRAIPALGTALLALSSLSLERGRRRGWPAGAAVAAGLGLAFLAVQAVVWRSLILAGLTPSGGPYASVFFGLTAFHAAHVLVGVAALGLLGARGSTGLPLRLWAIYWHMVGVLWAVMFLTVYLL